MRKHTNTILGDSSSRNRGGLRSSGVVEYMAEDTNKASEMSEMQDYFA